MSLGVDKNFKLKQDNCVQCRKTDAAKLVLLNSDQWKMWCIF